MKLISLTSNKKSFHNVYFHDGINIITGSQRKNTLSYGNNTYNGVGKSTLLHIVYFCLGCDISKSFIHSLPGWEFVLNFETSGNKHYCKRSVDNASFVEFDEEMIKCKEAQERLLKLCFGMEFAPNNMTWNTLFSRFARRYRASYSSYDSFVPKETDYSKILNNSFLLGINDELVIAKKELREKQRNASEMEKTIKSDSIFRQYYLENNDAEIDKQDLEYKIKKLEEEINKFRISDNYHKLETELNEISFRKKELENRRTIVSINIKNILESIKEKSSIKEEEIIKLYNTAHIEIPDMIKRSIEDVLFFHNELLNTRNNRLKKDLAALKKEQEELETEIMSLGKKMDELLKFLNTHGALDEYSALSELLSSYKMGLNKIKEYQDIINAYSKANAELKISLVEQDKITSEYLDSVKENTDNLKHKYSGYVRRFYPNKKSALIIENNVGENMLRYKIEAKIEDDSSDGINEVKIFCFDWLIFNCMKSNIQFLFHDSRLYANMDPRQRETLFKMVYETCVKNDIQYICSINEDALESIRSNMNDDEYKYIIDNNIILELKDDSDESKLLGIQADMNLEK